MTKPAWSVIVRVVDAHGERQAVALDVVVHADAPAEARAAAEAAAFRHVALVEHARGGPRARAPFGRGWTREALDRWQTSVVHADRVDDVLRTDLPARALEQGVLL